MGIQAVWGDDRTDTLWGFLPQMVSNDCAGEKMWVLSVVSFQFAAQPQRKAVVSLRNFDVVF